MSSRSIGLSASDLYSCLNRSIDSMKFELPKEYSSNLVRQGRAKDVSSFSSVEKDMEAMCDAYCSFMNKAIAKAIEDNNRKILNDLKLMSKKS